MMINTIFLYLPTPTPIPPSTPNGGGLNVPDMSTVLVDGTQRMVGYYNQLNTDGIFTGVQAIILLAIVIIGLTIIARAFSGQGDD